MPSMDSQAPPPPNLSSELPVETGLIDPAAPTSPTPGSSECSEKLVLPAASLGGLRYTFASAVDVKEIHAARRSSFTGASPKIALPEGRPISKSVFVPPLRRDSGIPASPSASQGLLSETRISSAPRTPGAGGGFISGIPPPPSSDAVTSSAHSAIPSALSPAISATPASSSIPASPSSSVATPRSSSIPRLPASTQPQRKLSLDSPTASPSALRPPSQFSRAQLPTPEKPGFAGDTPDPSIVRPTSYKQRQEFAKRVQEEEYSVSADFATQAGHSLSEEEKHVIENKGTEPAGSGTYDTFFPGQGYFACRKCGAPIYSYEAKFKTGCGWPAFDKCYTGSIKMRREEDDRVEIMCMCSAHLGHIFDNEDRRGKRSPIYEVSDHREVSLLSGFTNSVSAQCASTDAPAAQEYADDAMSQGPSAESILSQEYRASIQLVPEAEREPDPLVSRAEWWRALAWHQAHREEIEGHTACYEDEEDSKDEENLEDVENIDGVYVWVDGLPRPTSQRSRMMDPRGVHSAPPLDHGSIEAAETKAEEDKLVSLTLHLHSSLYGDGRPHQPRLSSGVDMTAATSAALTQEWKDVLHLRQRQREGTFYLGGHAYSTTTWRGSKLNSGEPW
ncbi:Peptide methionine sulfoxide reductase B2, chloroplastic [Cymbomonas tetramitiformis]|uniref:Peptide methionine sulfoxide reductase B2, chloroplastic n=1 Tax=Cymbomonas tetramitiformis TaxID=36881 RepID=A0AAE0GL96_9CHLO|nr:Peptide methionine sulfoxide reductase B2, chloroplastic [Cymbomonas tetramitiformis]